MIVEVTRFLSEDGWVSVSADTEGNFRIWSGFNDLWFRWVDGAWVWLQDGVGTFPERMKVTVKEDWVKVPQEIREMLEEVRSAWSPTGKSLT